MEAIGYELRGHRIKHQEQHEAESGRLPAITAEVSRVPRRLVEALLCHRANSRVLDLALNALMDG